MNSLVRMTFLIPLTLYCVAGTSEARSPILEEIEEAFIHLGEDVRPSVVNIEVQGRVRRGVFPENIEGYEELFKFFGISPDIQLRPFRTPPAQGAGIIYDERGHIVTSNHVVKDAGDITVRLWDGEEYEAQIIGSDPDTDLAVIKIDADRDLPAAKLGDSDELRVGQFAIAMGSPQGLEGSLSFGHISALGRESPQLYHTKGLRFQNLIQTDAAINLGNSGGPLCNIDGEVIGINMAIVFGADSLGFAIPVNTVKKTVPILITKGKVTRGYLGVLIADAADYQDVEGLEGLLDSNGAFVQNVLEDTPAERAGLKTYDVIRKIDGKLVESANDLVGKVADYEPGTKVPLEIWRDGKLIEVNVDLGEYEGGTAVVVLGDEVFGMRVGPLTPEMVRQLDLDADTEGVLVRDVEPGSPADNSGIREGDVILDVAKKKVTSVDEFLTLVRKHGKPGRSILVRVLRGSQLPFILKLAIPEEGVTEP